VTDGSVNQALLFKVTNTGNATDSFTLAATPAAGSAPNFTSANCRIYFDTANNGIFTLTDTQYTPGSNDPSLAAGASVTLFAVCDIPANAADGGTSTVALAATSKTFSGAPGAVKPGGGVGGVNAILGSSGGKASANGIYILHDVNFSIVLSEGVNTNTGAPVNVNQAVPGDIILYTVTVTPAGSASGSNTVVTDAIPAHTTYVAGSLQLNGTPLPSSGPGVIGDYNVSNPGAITVNFGSLAGTAPAQVISFQVTIN
jgi:uncharacterized repeat protein (TIGR01451 family)